MPLEEQIPDTLVRRAQRGDSVALTRLLEQVRPRLFRWALVHTSSPDDADDIVQEALLRASRHLGDYSFSARFTTWLHTIVRRTAAEWHRTMSRRAGLLAARHDPPRTTSQPEPTGELVALVRSCMDGLPARQREIFDMVDLREYAPSEVAELLSMNPATVRVHLLRARRTIRARLLERHRRLVEELHD